MRLKPVLPILFFSCAVLCGPFFITSPYFLEILIFIGIYSLITLGLNLLMGFAGQISLGHAAFYAIGAYSSAILTTRYNMHFGISIPIALCMAAGIAYIVGVPSLRLKGHYLAMATLAFGEIIHICLNAAVDLTGGPSGIAGIPQMQVGQFVFDTEIKYYYLVWAIFIVLFIMTQNIIHSRVGRALQSIHGSETAASAMGVNVANYKVQVFMLSAVFAALSGVLYAHYITFISPQTSDLMFSIRLVTMVVVGGMGHIWGGLLGAGILTVLPEFLSIFEDYDMLIYGCILLVMVMFLPGGVVRGAEVVYSKLINLIRRSKGE